MMSKEPKAIFHTLGCKLNYAETATIAGDLEKEGILRADDTCDSPELVVINTCSVTAEADRKCRQLIRQLHRRYPQTGIIVTGCYAQLCPADIADMDGVAVVVGNDHKGSVARLAAKWLREHKETIEVTPRSQDMIGWCGACSTEGDRTRRFLKIQDGCDYRCSYCTIPEARGPSRSPSSEEILRQVHEAVEAGAREIVLTGVNTGDFGRRRGESLLSLMQQLDKVDGIERYRISSIEPNLLTEEIIRFVASSTKFMPHFHIPLQAGSDAVLKLMGRRYDTKLYRSRIEAIRREVPDAFIGVDLIAGMRGETLDLWNQSLEFVKSLAVTRLHVFPFSERPGTRALAIEGAVDTAEKHRRVREMMEVSDMKLRNFSLAHIGQRRPVLIEHSSEGKGLAEGFTDNYLRVEISSGNVVPNTVVMVKIEGFDESTGNLLGVIDESAMEELHK